MDMAKTKEAKTITTLSYKKPPVQGQAKDRLQYGGPFPPSGFGAGLWEPCTLGAETSILDPANEGCCCLAELRLVLLDLDGMTGSYAIREDCKRQAQPCGIRAS